MESIAGQALRLFAHQGFVHLPIGNDQYGIHREDAAHDEQMARYHEHAPHEHAHAVRKSHQSPQGFAFGQQQERACGQLGSADERQQKLRREHRQHKRGCTFFRIPGRHDGGIARIQVVEVLGAGANEKQRKDDAERRVEFGVHGANLRTEGEWGILVLDAFTRKLEFDAGGGHGETMGKSLGTKLIASCVGIFHP